MANVPWRVVGTTRANVRLGVTDHVKLELLTASYVYETCNLSFTLHFSSFELST